MSDACALATLLFNDGQIPDARSVVLEAIRDFGYATEPLLEIGERLVEATADKTLRDALRAARRSGEPS